LAVVEADAQSKGRDDFEFKDFRQHRDDRLTPPRYALLSLDWMPLRGSR
jgi:hypothetical protein